MLLGDVPDQPLDQDRLADAGTAEQADLAALGVGSEEVDDLDSRLEDLLGRGEVLYLGRGAVDRPALVALDLLTLVDRLSEQVEDPAEGLLADRNRDRPAGVDHLVAALDAVGGVHCDGADAVVAEMLLHFEDQPSLGAPALGLDVDPESVKDLRDVVREGDIDDDARHLLDGPDVAVGRSAVRLRGLVDVRESGRRVGLGVLVSHSSPSFPSSSHESPSAPATTSRISWVISACRTRFISRVRSEITSFEIGR